MLLEKLTNLLITFIYYSCLCSFLHQPPHLSLFASTQYILSLLPHHSCRAILYPGSVLSEKQFHCSICLNIFDNPVSTPHSHSYYMNCTGQYWNGVKLCRCPLCKENFKKKPDLHINHAFPEITEQFKNPKGYVVGLGEENHKEAEWRKGL